MDPEYKVKESRIQRNPEYKVMYPEFKVKESRIQRNPESKVKDSKIQG